MKKFGVIITIVIVIAIVSFCIFVQNKQKEHITLATDEQSKIWVGTFQLAWNELINLVGDKVQLEPENPKIADMLNRQTFTKEQLSKSDYYVTAEELKPETKAKIETEVLKKFKERPTILDSVNFNSSLGQSYIMLSIIKKEFEYTYGEFDKLDAWQFGESKEKVKYFGIGNGSKSAIRKNVDVLFYNFDTDYAVKLKTKEGEEVILYRTNNLNKTFEELYNTIIDKEKNSKIDKKFGSNDMLRIPEIVLLKEIQHEELIGNTIKNNGYTIQDAKENIEFKLDGKGGRVFTQAILSSTLGPKQEVPEGRYYFFTNNFVIFLKEKGKEKPYLALKVDDTEYLVEEK